MSKARTAVKAVRAIGTAIRKGRYIIAGGFAAAAVKSILDDLGDAGIYDAEIPLEGYLYKISRNGVEGVLKELESGDRAEIIAASKFVLLPVFEKRGSGEGGSERHKKAPPLATSFSPLLNPTPSTWPNDQMVNGALLVVGESRSGKTTEIARLEPDLIVRVSEPLEIIDAQDNAIPFSSFVDALGLAIAASIGGMRVAVDSLRGLMYSLQGNTMEGGVSAGLFELLTTLNNICASVGNTIIFAVNPMTGNEDKLNTLLSRIEASVSGLMFMSNGRINMIAYRTVDGDRYAEGGLHDLAPDDVKDPRGFNVHERQETHIVRPAKAMYGPMRSARKDITAGEVVETEGKFEDPGTTRLPPLRFDLDK